MKEINHNKKNIYFVIFFIQSRKRSAHTVNHYEQYCDVHVAKDDNLAKISNNENYFEIKENIINNSLIKIHEIILKISNFDLLDIRKNIRYRCKSILFHIDDLIKRLNFIEDKLKQIDVLDDKKRFSILSFSEDTMMYIFDDIIFNFVSLIDYLGKFISNVYFKENKNWNRTHDKIKDLDSFPNQELKENILNHHREWINYLQGYRAKIFHYDKDNAEASQVFKWNNKTGMSTELKIRIPNRCKLFLDRVFKKSKEYFIKNSKNEKNNLEDATIIEAVLIISDMTFYIFQDIIKIIHIEYCK